MSYKPKKSCAYPMCINLTTEQYCEKHKQEATKTYDKYQRDNQTTAFYKSVGWRITRAKALVRDCYLCQRCLKDKKLTPADMVHHIVEVKEDWSKRLDINNLESLCNSCHNKVHGKRG
ncbi:HNH endonuclease signature motif containing protein [Bacillus wiedmannii]